jgi:opacity protein-like surface antigen
MRRTTLLFAGAKYLLAGAFVAGAFVAMSGGVNADGMAPKAKAAPPVQQATTWSGVYFGVNSGWSWADIGSTVTASPGPPADGVGPDGVHHDAPIVGGQLGIQHQFGDFVLGVETSLMVAYRDSYANVTCPNPAITCGKRFDDVFTIGPRLGWAMGKWMPYMTAGYANAAFAHESYITGTVTGLFLGRERFDGWYIGGGLDMALPHGWVAGLEYRHYEFGDETFLTHTPAGVLTGDVRTIDPSLDTITLRVSWKFDRPSRVEARPLK